MLWSIASLFLKLGFTAFGGPAAHIAMMRREVVEKRGWFTEDQFLQLVAATQLIPGPNSTELAIHIGQKKGGWKGLIIAGCCFILPAVLITGVFAWVYQSYGKLPEIAPFFKGIQPAIVPIIVMAIVPMAKASLKSIGLWVIFLCVLLMSFGGISEVVLLFGAGIIGAITLRMARFNVSLPILIGWTSLNSKLFFTFLKIGSILYGSGYVLFTFLDEALVQEGMLSKQQLTDAIAIGQFTPGPVFSSVTFIGYQINGIWGAIYATIGIFLPSFVLVRTLTWITKRLENREGFQRFMTAVNVASVALIASTCWSITTTFYLDWRAILILALSFVILWYKPINSAYIVVGGSVTGWVLWSYFN